MLWDHPCWDSEYQLLALSIEDIRRAANAKPNTITTQLAEIAAKRIALAGLIDRKLSLSGVSQADGRATTMSSPAPARINGNQTSVARA